MDLKLKDVAEILQVSEKTIYRWIKDGKIPFYRINHQYRFRTDEINQWAFNNKYDLVEPQGKQDESVSIDTFLRNGGIYYKVSGNSTVDTLTNCVDMIHLPGSLDKENLLSHLLRREEMASTAVGNGIAFPHPREPQIHSVTDERLYLCFPNEPIDYNSIDGDLIHSLFIIISANQTRHLRLLALLSHRCRQKEFIALLERRALREEILTYLEI